MKRILSALLVVALFFTLSACGKEEKKTAEHSVDVAYYAKLGQLPETDYKLGMEIEPLKKTLSEKAEAEGEEGFFDVTEGEETVRISTDMYTFHYEKQHAEKGVGAIVCLDGGFGFEQNTVSVTVKELLADYEGDEHVSTEAETFFLPIVQNCTTIAYTFGDYRLNFVFQDNALCGIVLYNPKTWTM